MNNRIKLRHACRETANCFKPASEHITKDFTDGSIVVKNHPDDVRQFVDGLALVLDTDAFKHIGGTQEIMNRLPRLTPTTEYLVVYDFYKVLRDSKYFSVERALKRIKAFGERKQGMKYTRKNARGHYTSACSPTNKAYTQSFCSEFNYSWKMILALGSRLCVGRDRELDFKTGTSSNPYIKATMVDGYDNKFTVHVTPNGDRRTFTQLKAFFNALDPELFHYTVSGFVFTVTVRSAQVPQLKLDVSNCSLEQKELVTKNVNWVDTKDFPVFKQDKALPIEEHYYKEMEKSVNEMTLIVDDYDRQIDELTGKADKMRAQRARLLHAMQELRK